MAAHRHHSDIVIAGLTVLGLVAWLAASLTLALGSDAPPKAVIGLLGAFVAAVLARRVLSDLDASELAMAAALALSLLIGVHYHDAGRGPDLDFLLAVVVAEAGVLAGAFVSKPRPQTAPWWMLGALAASAGFGTAVVAGGVTNLVYKDVFGVAVIVGVVAGTALAGRFVPGLRGRHGGVFTAILLAVLLGLRGHDLQRENPAVDLFAGAVAGLILGTLGTGLGSWIREAARVQADLPSARKVR